ncbi:MAG: EFR1 family ferrodoxin [Spirochaetaceae bacterium]|nr:EFR1 family ferrodoxin [Spirochaetaceae bacterium]
MKRAVFAYYTGTGNTLRALGPASEAVSREGYAIEWLDLGSGAPLPALGAGELLVLGFPSLGFSPPSLVVERLKSAGRLDGADAAVLVACGATWVKGKVSPGWSGAAPIVAASLLRRKGARVLATAEASYPENWTQVSNPAGGEEAARLIGSGDAEARAFGASLAAALGPAQGGGQGSFVRRNALTLSLGRFVGWIYRRLARKALARFFVADTSCTSCGLCERTCPARAIRMRNGLPAWNLACTSCNRCINVCPARSIQASRARLVLVLLPNLAAMFAALPAARAVLRASLPALPAGAFGPAAFGLGLVLFAAFTLLQVGPFDALLRWLERRPALRRAFSKGASSGFRRYLAPDFKPGASRFR